VVAESGRAAPGRPPHVIIVGGPNGAGKSTIAPRLVRDLLGVPEYVNADLIAQGLSAFDTESVAFQAGRVMLGRLRQLAGLRRDFAFETTLATRSYLRWLSELREDGYAVDLVFLWLPSPEMAIARVSARVRMGGHDVSRDVIRRRFGRGLENFFRRYRPLADRWWFFDNSRVQGPRLLASGARAQPEEVHDAAAWQGLAEHYR
jgi:predicted ABC-type ATPase